MSGAGRELVAKLEEFAGGLNWKDLFPKSSEFIALENWENHGDHLQGRLGTETVNSSNDLRSKGSSHFVASVSTADEYMVIHDDRSSNIFTTKLKGTGINTAVTFVWNAVKFDDGTALSLLGAETNQSQIIQVFNKLYVFSRQGTFTNKRNVVLENNAAVTFSSADFEGREMGIDRPGTELGLADTELGTGNISGRFKYLHTFIRKSVTSEVLTSGIVLSESAPNLAPNDRTIQFVPPVVSNILITDFGTTTAQQVTHRRLYRTLDLTDPDKNPQVGDDFGIVYLAVTDLSLTVTQFKDTLTDVQLQNQSRFITLRTKEHVPLPPCKHAVFVGNRIFCTDGEKIFFTNGIQEERYSETHNPLKDFLTADAGDGQDVRGLFKFNDTLIIVKDTRTGIIRNPADPVFPGPIDWTDEDVGSIHRNSIVETPFGLIGLTNKGVRIHNGINWSHELSDKILTENEADLTKRIIPIPERGTFRPVASGFFYEDSYYLRIMTSESTTSFDLFDFKTFRYNHRQPIGIWMELDQSFDHAIVYDKGSKIIVLNDNNTDNNLRKFFVGTKDITFSGASKSSTPASGVIQHGFIESKDGWLEFDRSKIFGRFSQVQKYIIKNPEAIHCAITDFLPDPRFNRTNRFFRAMVPSSLVSERLSPKIRGLIDAKSYYYGQQMHFFLHNDYNDLSRFNNGLIARHRFEDDDITSVIEDVSGNNFDLTLDNSGGTATILTTDTFSARDTSVVITNSAADVFTFKNTSALKISNFGNWTFGIKLLIPSGKTSQLIFENSLGGNKIHFTTSSTEIRLGVGGRVSTAAFSYSSTLAKVIFVKFRFLSGAIDTTSYNYKADLFIDGAKTAFNPTIDQAISVPSGFNLLRSDDNDGIHLDEMRVYDRALSDEEIIAITEEFYSNKKEKKDQEFF